MVEIQQALKEASEEVLEKMFFVRGMEGGDCQPSGGADLHAGLDFEGEPGGSLRLSLSESAARSVAADFLAAEEYALSMRQIEEVICELANMICGSLLSKLERDARLRLSSPRVFRAGAAESKTSGGERAEHSAAIAGGILTITVLTEGPICSQAARSAF